MKKYFFPEKKSCVDAIAEVFAAKCKDQKRDVSDCVTSITVGNLSECGFHTPKSEEVERAIKRLDKPGARAGYFKAEFAQFNIYLSIQGTTYDLRNVEQLRNDIKK